MVAICAGILLFFACFCLSSAKYIELDQNGKFKNILVSITNDVPFHPDLIANLKFAFADASRHLGKSTRLNGLGPFYFGEVFILLPETWDNSHIDAIDKSDVTWQSANIAHFRVVNNSKLIPVGSKVQGGCGQSNFGESVIIGKEDIVDREMLRKLGKQLVREFTKLRYGVFDEFNGPEGPHAYYSKGIWKPVVCSMTIKGTFRKNGNGDPCEPGLNSTHPDPNCMFNTSLQRIQTAQGSLMFTTYMASVEKFCSSDSSNPDLEHNKEAPNPQNIFCDKQSVQSVMLQHPDYHQVINRVGNETKIPKVTFKVVKQSLKKRLILVLDVSSSMRGSSLKQMQMGVIQLIKLLPINEFSCGMISFSSTVNILHQLKPFTETHRKTYIDLINSLSADGWTAIGDALAEAMQMLGVNLDFPSDKDVGYIVLMSDGQNTKQMRFSLEEAIEKVKRTSIIVDVVAISSAADNRLTDLYHSTKGHYSFVSLGGRTEFHRAVFSIFQYKMPEERQQIIFPIQKRVMAGTLPAYPRFFEAKKGTQLK